MSLRPRLSALIVSASGVIGIGARATAQGTPSPRPGLTSEARPGKRVGIARESLVELRKKTEGAAKPDVDRREYVVGVELLATKEPENQSQPAQSKAKTGPPEGSPGNTTKAGESEKATTKPLAAGHGPLALVTSYRYFDDITVFATVDLERAGRQSEAAQHLRTALSDEEYEEAKALAESAASRSRRFTRSSATSLCQPPVQSVHRQGRSEDPPRDSPDLQGRYQGSELSQANRRPDHA